MLPLLLALCVFVGLLLVVLGVAWPLVQRDAVQTRLNQFAERPRSLEEIELSMPFTERVLRPLIKSLARVVIRVQDRRDPKQRDALFTNIQRRLTLAGNPSGISPADFLGIKALVALALSSFLFLMATATGKTNLALLMLPVGAVGGYLLPEMWLTRKIKARQQAIVRALPDALDLLVISVEAGLGFDGAVKRVAERADNPLAHELGRALAEMQVGRPRKEALKGVVERTQVPDLANFVSALVQAENLGVSVSKVLTTQADQMRTLRRQRAEEKANQAPIKMLFPMAIFIFPAICVVIMGPLLPTLIENFGNK